MARPGPNRQYFQFPRRGHGFRGENTREGLTDEVFMSGHLARLRNYHLVGRGRALKRKGDEAYVTAAVNGANAVQALKMYEWGSTRRLVSLCNGGLFYKNGSAWDDISGALSFDAGKDNRVRTTHFRDGSGAWMVGTSPGNNALWKWKGTGAAAVALGNNPNDGPSWATDVSEFRGRLWAINTDNGDTILEYSDDGLITTWGNNGGYNHCSRRSPGVGLSRHGQRALLVFHRESIHAVTYDPQSVDPFVYQPVDETVGCIATHSIGHSKGITYFAGPDGFYRMTSPGKKAEYIGFPEETNWGGLNESRREQIEIIVRGEPWNEIIWLASDGSSTEHNLAFVWNTEIQAWSVFDSSAGYFTFNCGTNFIDTSGKDVTVLGGYDGVVDAAWGDDNYDTGNFDNGAGGRAPVESTFWTGMLDLGYLGIKRMREMWIYAGAEEADKDFTLDVVGLGETAIVRKDITIPVQGDKLTVDFIFDQSRFAASDLPAQGRFKVSARSRMFQYKLTEQNTTKPHTIYGLVIGYQPRGMQFNP